MDFDNKIIFITRRYVEDTEAYFGGYFLFSLGKLHFYIGG